ncbi:MAG: ATP-binding cassette domain-containing protein [Deltaproteobacteria bacterium]|nr:ATP-binding cassette domain-containing protein [Deltaproteobacteria bacterium]
MGLKVHITKQLPHFEVDVAFSCDDRRVLALVGPSGAGKTTIIRMIAGLQRPDGGTISYNGEVWFDSAKGIMRPPQERSLGFVFQDYTLFPHLNVYKNVAFAAHSKDEVVRLLKLFDIWHLRDRRQHEISGGERQRCAICQALARRPRILLLDEPFSALDANTRRNMRDELKDLRNQVAIPIIHVTHDIDEALFLADDVLPLVNGKIVRKWMLQFMLKDRNHPGGSDEDFKYGFTRYHGFDRSVLYDSMEAEKWRM